MRFETEIVEEKQKALIISKINYSFIDFLKSHLKKFSVEPFFSSILPKSYAHFDYFYIIDTEIPLNKIQENIDKKFIFIFLQKNKPSHSLLKSNLKNVKIIEVDDYDFRKEEIDKILWFSFSETKEKLLKIGRVTRNLRRPDNEIKINIKKYFTKKNFIYFTILFFIIVHLLFIPFIMVSSFFFYKSYSDLKEKNYIKLSRDVSVANSLNRIGEKFYSTVRPSYLFFGIALWSDNIIEINKNSTKTLSNTKTVLDNVKEIQRLVFVKNKTVQEKDNLKLRFQKLNQSLEDINDSLIIINQKLDLPLSFIKKLKNNLVEASDLLDKSRKLLVYTESILSQTDQKKYLVFFANNMELRPGGGFIGSFAIITIKNYEIQDIKVEDVYDADGQLTVHIDPPKPIERYLNIPHWFLRDSNFSPDFLENYEKGLFFLEKELGLTDFSGGILITTTAVENILSAFDNIYLPDFKENINSKNFYLKTQFYAEKNFFPGSIQKQVFLSSVIQQILLNLETISSEQFFLAFKKSLDEKQIVVYLDDPTVQTLFDTSFWSGRVIEPKCLSASFCLLDYLFPYDANVGANKANFFINRYFHLKTTIDSQGEIHHFLSIKYQNSSPSEIFPTGTYRNYFQLLLPKNSLLRQITKDGVLVEDADQKDDLFKLIGFFFEVPPKKSVEIKIDYQLEDKIENDRKIYQLVFQKQIGANNSDLILDFSLNKNISLVNQNFSPLVKDNQILYNTNLSTDKIFFMELSIN
ncbi:MAG: DUF4012 domain-containing protein [Candidatus Roizmanbacteria bacterium]